MLTVRSLPGTPGPASMEQLLLLQWTCDKTCVLNKRAGYYPDKALRAAARKSMFARTGEGRREGGTKGTDAGRTRVYLGPIRRGVPPGPVVQDWFNSLREREPSADHTHLRK